MATILNNNVHVALEESNCNNMFQLYVRYRNTYIQKFKMSAVAIKHHYRHVPTPESHRK